MANELKGKTIAFVATDGVEQIELTEPWKAVEKAGAKPVLIAPEGGEIQGFNHREKGDTFQVDEPVKDATVEDYDGLVLPGGVANPDELRIKGCHPIPELPSPGPAALWVSQRSPATYMNTWSAFA